MGAYLYQTDTTTLVLIKKKRIIVKKAINPFFAFANKRIHNFYSIYQ
jgi:hypothetical protein